MRSMDLYKDSDLFLEEDDSDEEFGETDIPKEDDEEEEESF